MPFWLARKAAPHVWKRLPWKTVWVATLWLVKQGQERAGRNLTSRERTELLNLVKKSQGRPGNLAQRDRTRVKHIVGKAIRG